jgi:hypothetical protein
MENKQTAVEWFVANIDWLVLKNCPWQYEMLIEKAKEMEKEQVVNAYSMGVSDEGRKTIHTEACAEQYYDETYGK